MTAPYSPTNSTKFFSQISEEAGYQITDPTQSVGWVGNPRFRGTLELVWTCVFTLFTCLWASLHLNIPAPEDTELTKFRRKLKWTFIAASFPELVVGIAFVDWWEARHDAAIMKKNDLANWDSSLCAFVRMGGIWLRGKSDCDHDNTSDETAPFICVEAEIVRKLIQEGTIGQDCVTHEMVDEKSKEDWFVKLVACCQAFYFGLQCVGRLGTGLPITTLEISTAVFAVYALVVYAFWWNKPVDVAMPIILTISQQAFDRVVHLYEPSTPNSYWEKYKYGGNERIIDITKLRRVPNDLSMTNGTNHNLSAYPTLLSALIFAGLHCLAWNLYFPTQQERLIWRISCIVMVVVPLISLILSMMGLHCKRLMKTLRYYIIIVIAVVFYSIARFYLIFGGFIYLRAAPVACYEGVDWVGFIPHIG